MVQAGRQPESELVGPERQQPGLVRPDRQRLLAEDVLARLQSHADLLIMVGVGRGDDDGVHLVPAQRLGVAGRDSDAVLAGDRPRRGLLAVVDGDQPAPSRRHDRRGPLCPEEPRPYHQEPHPKLVDIHAGLPSLSGNDHLHFVICLLS